MALDYRHNILRFRTRSKKSASAAETAANDADTAKGVCCFAGVLNLVNSSIYVRTCITNSKLIHF